MKNNLKFKYIFIAALILFFTLLLYSCDTEREIKVEYLADAGGYISGNAVQAITSTEEKVEFLQVTAIANEGYRFVGWSDGKAEATRRDTLSKSSSFTAFFEKITYITVEYKASEGGTIIGTSTQLGEGKINTTQVQAIANEGYRFVGWDDGVKSVARNDEATENKVFTALFKKVLNIEFTCNSSEGKISGRLKQTIYEGMSTAQVYAIPKVGYKFIGWSTGDTTQSLTLKPNDSMVIYAIFERLIEGLPVISINTENNEPITSKEIYINCFVTIDNTTNENSLENAVAKIRGRGNTSWDSPKKPYRIKLDKPTDLFGSGEAKNWTLIANHTDLSLIRNYLAYSVASVFDTQKCTSTTQYVDLYLNGEYIGVYLLCEQIEVHGNRVDIADNSEIDTGYLIELDGREDGYGFYVNEEFYAIKSPDTDDSLFTDEHTEFIKAYLEKCLDAVSSDDYSKIEELIDTKSFAQAYLVFELFNCVDVGFASFYMYKDAGGKLQCGPVWDFDRSLGITGNVHGADNYDTLWAKQENTWFNNLLNHKKFVDLVASELDNNLSRIKDTLYSCYEYVYTYEESFLRNFEKWNILGTYVWPNSGETGNLKTWQAQVEYTREYLNNSLEFLKSVYLDN